MMQRKSYSIWNNQLDIIWKISLLWGDLLDLGLLSMWHRYIPWLPWYWLARSCHCRMLWRTCMGRFVESSLNKDLIIKKELRWSIVRRSLYTEWKIRFYPIFSLLLWIRSLRHFRYWRLCKKWDIIHLICIRIS